MQWSRRQYTTKGSDPTVVVEWSKNGFAITEFQNVYTTNAIETEHSDWMAEELHKTLEHAYQVSKGYGEYLEAARREAAGGA